MDDNVVALSNYRAKGKSDLGTLISLHNEISKIENPQLREFFENAWHEGAKIASLIYPTP